MSRSGKTAHNDAGGYLELHELPSSSPTSPALKSPNSTVKCKVENETIKQKMKSAKISRVNSYAETDLQERQEIFHPVPPDPPPPVFVEIEYGNEFSKASLKRSKTYKVKVATSGENGDDTSARSKKKFPETVINLESTQMETVKQNSTVADRNDLDLYRKTPSLTQPVAALGNPMDIQLASHYNMRSTYMDIPTTTDAGQDIVVIKYACPKSMRICYHCCGIGKLPKEEKLGTETQCKERKSESAKYFPTERKLFKRRHSTGNIDNLDAPASRNVMNHEQQNNFQPPKQSTAVRCIQHFLAFLYYVGMSPIKPVSVVCLPKWFVNLQLIYFTLFTTISIMQALADVKVTWMEFSFEQDFITFLTFGYYCGNCLARIYNTHALVSSAAETSVLLEKIQKVNSVGASNGNSGRGKTIVITIGTISMFLVAFDTIFSITPFSSWTPADVILDQSMDMSELLFLWSSDNFTNARRNLYEQFGAELTLGNWVLGLCGNFVNYCGVLHGCMMLDMWPILALQINLLHSHFNAKINETKKLTKVQRGGRCPLSIHWEYYIALRDVCDQSHCVFGKFLKIVHLQNVLQFGYFLLKILELKKRGVSASLLVDAFSAVKVALTYYFVQNLADKNEEYEDCVIECAECRPTIEMGGVEVSVAILIKHMKKHPIGIGRGDFFVNEAFVMKIACFVGSLFVLLAENVEPKCVQNQ